MPPLSVTLLGGFEARSSSGPIVVSLRKAQALLAYLAFRPGQPHPRSKLAALSWGDAGEEEARNSLRQTLFGLRRAVAVVREPVLLTDGESVTLSAPAVSVDVATFERLVRQGTTRALEAAAALYKGELLEGLIVPEVPFEDWLMGERQRLREQAVGALEKLLRDHLAAGENDRAIRAALRLLTIEPLLEAVHRALMRLYGREGRHAMALRQYQACVDVLQRELRVEPEAETKDLYRQLLRQRSAGSGPARRARERHVRPVGPPLVGRDAELATLRRALRQAMTGHGQVIVVQGEAGIGKTRLVEELAADVGDGDCRLLHGRAYPSERILPFSVWMNALRAGQVVARADVLQALDPVWRRQLARLFPEIHPAGPALANTTNDYRQLVEAVDRLVARLAAEERLLFVLEDVHWSDDMSLRLLAFLGRRAVDRPMLMIATVRSEEMSDAPELGQTLAELSREQHLTAVTLEPLSRADTLALARSLTPAGLEDWAPSRVADYVWAVSDGNPLIDWSGALDAGRRALDIAVAVGDPDLMVATHFRLGAASYSPGDYRGAIELLERCLTALASDMHRKILGLSGVPSVLVRHWMTWCRAELGDFAAGIVQGEEAVRIASDADHAYSVGAACHGLGYLHLRRGSIDAAIPLLERSLAACRSGDGSLPWLWAASALGAAYALAGRHAEALPLLEGAVQQAEQRQRREGHAQRLAWLAEAHLLADRLDEAREVGTRALHAAREHRERGHEAWALRILGEIHATSEAADEAETSYLLALSVAEELGMRPLLAHCHLGLARLYRRRGRAMMSRSHFLGAIDLLRGMEMTRWLAAAQAEAMTPPVAEPT